MWTADDKTVAAAANQAATVGKERLGEKVGQWKDPYVKLMRAKSDREQNITRECRFVLLTCVLWTYSTAVLYINCLTMCGTRITKGNM